ncbi:CHAP domain-containing protein [Deinococcus hohokamensis]|uniref:CHAP domain-containing protein n=1 Tax=Deinococcus hohokamensis TaxID=309883 RepID=A0ABV9I7B5_9DEIO
MIAPPQVTGPKPKPKPNPQIVPPRATPPTKANKQQWQRTFLGKAKGVNFQLRIIRDPSGQLLGRYFATPGSGKSWHLEGVLREDNSFTLKGTDNKAIFEGKFGPDGRRMTTSFTNKTTQGEFHVDKMTMMFAFVPVKPHPPAGTQPTSADHLPSDSDTQAPATLQAVQALAQALGKPFNQTLVAQHMPLILRSCSSAGIIDPNQIAYVFATAVWETNGFRSFNEKYMPGWTAKEYFEQSYGPSPSRLLPKDSRRIAAGETQQSILAARRKRNIEELGNTEPGDGYKFRGRGYVHLTGRAVYQKAQYKIIIPSGIKRNGKVPDIVEMPDLASSDSEIAALILGHGMAKGTFTGRKLDDHINSKEQDFMGARAIIGVDSAGRIAQGAAAFVVATQAGDPQDQQASTITEITSEREREILRIPVGGYTAAEQQNMSKGLEIGSLNGIPAYYNGKREATTWGSSFSKDGSLYYGFKWQCVEFVRRYTSLNSGRYISHRGDASTFYKASLPDGAGTFDGLKQHRNFDLKTGLKVGSHTKPQPGDVIVIGTATYGHVAIIAEVNDTDIVVAQQNVGTNFKEQISLESKDDRWILGGRVLCWLSK